MKNKHIKYLRFVYVFLNYFLISSCDYYDTRLKVINNTKTPIVIAATINRIPKLEEFNGYEFYKDKIISQNDTFEYMKFEKNGWENYVASSYNKKLNIIIISVYNLEKYKNIDSIISNHHYSIKSYDVDNLSKKEWTIKIK